MDSQVGSSGVAVCLVITFFFPLLQELSGSDGASALSPRWQRPVSLGK